MSHRESHLGGRGYTGRHPKWLQHKPKRTGDKEFAMVWHVAKRAKRRFGLDLPSKRQNLVVRKIQNKEAIFIRDQSRRVSVWELEFEGHAMTVWYDRKRQQLITLLPTWEARLREENRPGEMPDEEEQDV